MKKRILALLLASLVILGALAGCTSDDGTAPQNNDSDATTTSADDTKEDSGPRTLKTPVAEKITSFDNIDSVTSAESGWYYKSNGKYGIMSIDGSKDTSAKYDYVSSEGEMFSFATTSPTSIDDLKSLNCLGLMNGNGEVLLEEKYAAFKQLNDRYYQVMEVTELTDNEDDALIFMSDNQFAIFADEDDTFFKGNWYIFDVEKKQLIDGVSGTQAYYQSAYGNYLKVVTDDEQEIVIDGDGNKVTDNISFFDNGCYKISDGTNTKVFDENSNELFTYSEDDYTVSFVSGDYFIASNYDAGTKTLLDKSGKEASAAFSELPNVYGNIIECSGTLYDFDKNEIYKGEGSLSVKLDDASQAALLVQDDKKVMYMDLDGNILASIDKTENIYAYSSDFMVSDDSGETNKYYCLKTKAFDIEGSMLRNWLFSTGEFDAKSLIECMDGTTLIEGSYTSYTCSQPTNNKIYTFAETVDGDLELYSINF